MFKLLRKKILEGIIKDVLEKLPEYKEYAILLFAEHKDEILEKVKHAIEKAIKDFISKKIEK